MSKDSQPQDRVQEHPLAPDGGQTPEESIYAGGAPGTEACAATSTIGIRPLESVRQVWKVPLEGPAVATSELSKPPPQQQLQAGQGGNLLAAEALKSPDTLT